MNKQVYLKRDPNTEEWYAHFFNGGYLFIFKTKKKKRLPYDYENEYYPWEDNCKQVKRIQYTINIY